jgi:hypothetical protein
MISELPRSHSISSSAASGTETGSFSRTVRLPGNSGCTICPR